MVYFPKRKTFRKHSYWRLKFIRSNILLTEKPVIGDGPMQEVISPVCLKTSAGPVPRMIGAYPLLTEKESLEALNAAITAYNSGRGLWPTMSVGDRIGHLEELAYRMGKQKAQIVNLLMWEVGKSFRDSEKEFDRTIAYIKDTVAALKDLDRVSSRFIVEEAIIGQVRRAPLGVVLAWGPSTIL